MPQPSSAAGRPVRALLAAAALASIQTILYLMALHPGVGDGDAAELQWAAPLLGIAHSPGYALQITAGKLFTLLPLGGDAAWRMNLMSAVFGVLGALALFSAVRRITGRTVPALVAQAILAFGSVYWSQSLIAEVYVFGAAFLCMAIDAGSRFIHAGRVGWLAASALLLGVAVTERPSEILIVPAFAGLMLAFRRRVPMPLARWLLAAACLAAPFALAVALNVTRADPDRLAARDDALRDRLIGYQEGEVTFPYLRAGDPVAALRSTVPFMLGLPWKERIAGVGDPGSPGGGGIGRTAAKYASLLAGGGLFGDRFAPTGATDPMLKAGISPGILGLSLALLGAILWRRETGWVVLGAVLLAGNLLFVLAYDAWDNLTFTIPGQIGLALLAGLGAAGPSDRSMRPRAARALGLVSLLIAISMAPINFARVNRNTQEESGNQRLMARVAEASLPENAAILTKYWPAMTLRYIFWIRADRPDVSVIHAIRGTHLELALHLHDQGRALFVTGDVIPKRIERELAARTPEELRSLGLLSLGDLTDIPLPEEP